MDRIHGDGLFEVTIANTRQPADYEFVVLDREGRRLRVRDPYRVCSATFSQADEDSFVQGTHVRLFDRLGAHPTTKGDGPGVTFAVWAPHAQRVSVVGTFNGWDGRRHQMPRIRRSGVWELFIPDAREGDLYKYEIKTPEGHVFLRSDPFAVCTEVSPKTASIVYDLRTRHTWRDAEWEHRGREQVVSRRGLFVDVLDLESRPGGATASHPAVPTMAKDGLLESVKKAGFTHVEFKASPPGCWGSASFFAPGLDYGMPEEFMEFVDSCHERGIGVVVPVLSSRVPEGLDGLAWFDGMPLYEASDPSSPGAAFDLSKGEVRSFLLSNAVFWLELYHADGLRTDRHGAAVYRTLSRWKEPDASGLRLVVCEPLAKPGLSESEVTRLVKARHPDPYSLLGPHFLEPARALTIRAMVPGAAQIYARLEHEPEVVYQLQAIHPDGLFETTLSHAQPDSAYRLGILEAGGQACEILDPYAVTAFSVTPLDQHLFGAGNHYLIYEKLGAHPRTEGGVRGVGFAVWAPNADGVSVVGPFNQWDGRRHQMRRHGSSGVWEIFIPGLGAGELYKYEIRARNGDVFLKSDPYAFFCELSPGTASIVYPLEGAYAWGDQEWMERRRRTNMLEQPVAVYEVHLGSWIRERANELLSYQEAAKTLIGYVKQMGFTHIELLPIAEHPYEPSWGYQVSNFYAPTARFGGPKDLMTFVDACHQNGLGVIMDWVPGHFPKDAHALAWFDGTCLYEHADPRQGEHPDWGTLIFNYGRPEVENFLIANALFWLETYHVDGLRVDAVSSMLYLDYSRPARGWIPNIYGGRENLEAVEFLKHVNAIVHARFPGIMIIAEEATAWPKVSWPTDQGGLGFGFKWNMGWMHDILLYMSRSPKERKHYYHELIFSLVYAFNENFILPLSHDEVVHLKRSLLNKMPGNEQEKFANLRLLFTFMYGHPGKKLLFMGGEFGQTSEWDHSKSLEWYLLQREPHRRLNDFVKELNRLYHSERSLFEADFKSIGFEWLDMGNADGSIIAFLRKAKDPRNVLLFALNFSAVSQPEYRIGVPYPVFYEEILNSSAEEYGGCSHIRWRGGVQAEMIPWSGREFSIPLSLPALSAVVLKPAAPDTGPIQDQERT